MPSKETWNPITGCTACSPGCDHCYARRMAQRLRDLHAARRNGEDQPIAMLPRQGHGARAEAGDVERNFRLQGHPLPVAG